MPYIINEKLLSSYKNFDASIHAIRSEILFTNNHSTNNCKTYFKMKEHYDVVEFVNNKIVENEYLICDALKILSKSLGVNKENINTLNLGKKLLTKLDVRTFRSSLSKLGNDSAYTLKQLFSNDVTSTDFVALYEDEDWAFTVEIIAIANINNNSKPDWIIWVLDESKSGNYRAYSTFIIFDPNQKDYRATPYVY